MLGFCIKCHLLHISQHSPGYIFKRIDESSKPSSRSNVVCNGREGEGKWEHVSGRHLYEMSCVPGNADHCLSVDFLCVKFIISSSRMFI